MEILCKYKGEKNWEEIDLETMLEKTEGGGYWEKGSVINRLKDGQKVFTPYAFYKMRSK